MKVRIISMMILLFIAVESSFAEKYFSLVNSNKTNAAIILPDKAHSDEIFAASELQEYIKKVSNAQIDICKKIDISEKSIFIGKSLLKDGIDKLGSYDSAFIINVTPDSIYLAGNTPEATLFAIYELLEKLGVRWYWPGELGTVIPEKKNIKLPVGMEVYKPSFPHRHLQGVPHDIKWYKRQKFGGVIFMGQHGIDLLPAFEPEKDKNLLALVDGKREMRGANTKYCISNPEVLKRAIAYTEKFLKENPEIPHFGMGPTDGLYYCECEDCRALDGDYWDPLYNRVSVTDRYIWFFNQVLEAIEPNWPDKKLAFYIYQAHMFTPVRYTPNINITGSFAPIGLCRIHGASNPLCPDRSLYKYLMEEWGKLLPELWERGYYYNLASAPFPFSKVHTLNDEMTLAYKNNIVGWRVQSNPSWVSNGLTLYVAGKLMWDVNADVDAIVNDFYEKFFGPAAEPMGKWLDMVDSSYRDTDCHVGASIGLPEFFPPEKMKLAKKYFAKAEKLVKGKQPYQERVRLFNLNFGMLDDYLNMWYARNSHDFKNANMYYESCLDKIDQQAFYYLLPEDNMPAGLKDNWSRGIWTHIKYAPLLCKPDIGYLSRFNDETIKDGYAKTNVTGKLVAPICSTWDFLIDSKGVGEILHWYSEKYTGGNWQTISTDKTWSDQGYHYYKGFAWYKNTVTIPSKHKGKKLLLWFGAIDELAKVWINDQYLGESFAQSPELPGYPMTFKPFEFDVTDYIRFDKPNTISVKVTNIQFNEIGTGGIIAPVMIYTPLNNYEQ